MIVIPLHPGSLPWREATYIIVPSSSSPNLILQFLNQQHKTQLQILILHLIADFHKNAWLGPEVSLTWTSKGFLLKQTLQLLRINSTCSGRCILKLSSFNLSCWGFLIACNLFGQKDRCEAPYYLPLGSLDRWSGRNGTVCLCVWVLTSPD